MNVFLHVVIQYKKKKKLFCAFIDLEKVFGTVWRDGSWYKKRIKCTM
jgi:hypothetical protein